MLYYLVSSRGATVHGNLSTDLTLKDAHAAELKTPSLKSPASLGEHHNTSFPSGCIDSSAAARLIKPLAAARRAMNDKLLSVGDVCVRRSDAELLRPGRWLNDTCIALYFELLKLEKYPHAGALLLSGCSAFFLLHGGAQQLRPTPPPPHSHFHFWCATDLGSTTAVVHVQTDHSEVSCRFDA